VAGGSLAWLLLPGISLLAATLPIVWLVSMGMRGLAGGSRQRQWGLFAGGLAFSPVMIIVLELLALIGMLLAVGVVLALNPELAYDLSTLVARLASAPPGSDNWLNILSPYIVKPAFLAAILAYTSLLIPLIEEAVKPLGLWLLAGRRLTPAEGFVGGLISGAGFALFENLSALSGGGEDWALLASSRISTALLHMLTSGLVGWALAHAWSQGRYLRLGISYTAAVALHGIWNALGIASFSLPQFNQPSLGAGEVDAISSLTVVGLGVLTGVNFMVYYSFNRRLQPKPEVQIPQVDAQLESTLSQD
jgi:RsiW-degrading membrane proteinase PrsW (M82 family)